MSRFSIITFCFFWCITSYGYDLLDSKTFNGFASQELIDLPTNVLVPGGFVGICDGRVVVIGGDLEVPAGMSPDLGQVSDSIFVVTIQNQSPGLKFAGLLPDPIKNIKGVAYEESLFVIGGQNSSDLVQHVYQFGWDAQQEKVELLKRWPDLPVSLANYAIASLGDWLYVAGHHVVAETGPPVPAFFRLNLNHGEEWEEMEAWPGLGDGSLSLVNQSNGSFDCLYLIEGISDLSDTGSIYRYDQSQKSEIKKWKEVGNRKGLMRSFSGGAVGQSQILIWGGAKDGSEEKTRAFDHLLSFNTLTGSWYELSEAPVGVSIIGSAVLKDRLHIFAETHIEGSGKQLFVIDLDQESNANLSPWDYAAIFGYLGLMVGLGWYYSRKNKTSNDYFLGGQKIPFWAAGLSLMATQASAIGFMAIPAKSFMTDWSYFAGVFTWFIAVPVVIYAFVPFYRKLNVTSVYEYLDKRFNTFIRSFVAILYLLFQLIGRLGAIIYLPSIALAAVTGLDVLVCVMLIGVLATIYTVLGGMYAVIWTDVLQSFVLFGGIIFCIGYVFFTIDVDFSQLLTAVKTDRKMSLGSLDLDVTMAVFWVIVVGNIFNRIATLSTDQSMVQRYMTTSSEKESRKALWTTVFVSIPWAILVFGLGTALYLFYKFSPEMMHPLVTADEIVPFFIAQNLPVGIRGVVIAGIFAAAMSSVDSSIHSSTTVVIRDFLQRKIAGKDELHQLGVARYITILLGVIGTGVAIFMTYLNISSVWDLILEVLGFFAGAMTGVFVLGIFTTKSNSQGATIGVILSAAVVLFVQNFTQIHFFLYSGIGIIACVILGYFASFLFHSQKNLEGLTIFTIKK